MAMKTRLPPQPEFSRPVALARISTRGNEERIKADAKECLALAKRFDLPAVHALSAKLMAKPWRGGGLKVTGTVTCDLEQVSVVSLEVFRSTEEYEVERYFLNKAVDEELDIDPLEGDSVDLGEIAAETVALELDPYPRKPGEQFASAEDPKE